MPKHNRVVVTGMGVIAPNGIGLDAFWDSLIHGRSGVGPITHFDASSFKSRIAGEVKGFRAAGLHRSEIQTEADGAPHPIRLRRDEDGPG